MKLCKPALPKKAVIIGEKYKKALELSLERLGVFVLWMPDNPFVDQRLSGHADLSAINIGEKCLVIAPYLSNTEFLDELDNYNLKYKFADIVQEVKYPLDAQLNVCYVGDSVICNPKTATKDVIHGNIIAVKQGYSRCCVCVVSENAIITADKGIADAVGDMLDVLLISPGHISLEGFGNGFIGGASFKIDDKLYFSGSLDTHPDREKILLFLDKYHVKPIFLTDGKLFDFGSAIIL